MGLLMESHVPPRVVRSTAKGIDQHSVFSWEVAGDDFLYLEGLTDGAQLADAVLTEWLAQFSDEEAAVVVDAFFQAVEASGARDASDLLCGGTKALALVPEAAKNMDPGARATLLAALKPLTEIAARRLAQGVSVLWPGSRAPSQPQAAERSAGA